MDYKKAITMPIPITEGNLHSTDGLLTELYAICERGKKLVRGEVTVRLIEKYQEEIRAIHVAFRETYGLFSPADLADPRCFRKFLEGFRDHFVEPPRFVSDGDYAKK
ncbi:MAG: hypothetical protein NT120_04665 [Candidatus Aenigmarchaeota archaeon]|nr:hypothetical protein [Candidatus Aenigmarchaeota archaeon]